VSGLTVKNGQERRVVEQSVEHFQVDFLDLIGKFSVFVLNEPLEHVLLDHQVAVEEQRISIPEVNQGREGFDRVPLGQNVVVDFDHLDSVGIALVVNVLQLLQDFLAGTTIGLILKLNLKLLFKKIIIIT